MIKILYIVLLAVITFVPYIESKKYRVGIQNFMTPLSGEIDFEIVKFFRVSVASCD